MKPTGLGIPHCGRKVNAEGRTEETHKDQEGSEKQEEEEWKGICVYAVSSKVGSITVAPRCY